VTIDLYVDTTIAQLIEQMNYENLPQKIYFCAQFSLWLSQWTDGTISKYRVDKAHNELRFFSCCRIWPRLSIRNKIFQYFS